MKRIITLNIAGRKNIEARSDEIIRFLNEKDADTVCLQEVTFDSTGESLAHKINSKLREPYDFVQAVLVEEYIKDGKIQTDGLAILSRSKICEVKTITLTKVPDDENGRPDFHKRIAQIVAFEDGIKIANTHLASNNNSHLQFEELLKNVQDECIMAGDFNLPRPKILKYKKIWGKKYSCSIDFKDYISFPKENRTFDYFMIPQDIEILDVYVTEGLSDHNAILCEINI